MSSFLFTKNFLQLIERGLDIKPLLNSKIFLHEFDLDAWPQTHSVPDTVIRGYNHSIFVLQLHYKTVFHEDHFNVDTDEQGKVYKIKYTLNLLP